MKIAIIQFPGSNCERESMLAVKRAGMEPVEFLLNEPVEKLRECEGYFIVGGFSYEDRSRAGIIASLDPVMKTIKEESEKGKPVLGICNGAQILVETGMVPGLKNYRIGMALGTNKRIKNGHVLGTGFYNGWVNIQLTAPEDQCAFTKHMKPGDQLCIPVAHAEGRFIMPEKLLRELKEKNLTVFRYVDAKGNLSPEFPVNPNGSMDNLAAVCNPAGNVMAMMPHPERSPNGDIIFSSMRDYINSDTRINLNPLNFVPEDLAIHNYHPDNDTFEFLVDLIITDNEAVSVENALQRLGLPVKIARQTHWEVKTTTNDVQKLKKEIIASGELFNSNKEKLVSYEKHNNSISFLVRYQDDVVGQHKLEALKHWFNIDGIQSIQKGILWTITAEKGNINEIAKNVLDTHILFNRYSHICYKYS